jgi:hypothetical protein
MWHRQARIRLVRDAMNRSDGASDIHGLVSHYIFSSRARVALGAKLTVATFRTVRELRVADLAL